MFLLQLLYLPALLLAIHLQKKHLTKNPLVKLVKLPKFALFFPSLIIILPLLLLALQLVIEGPLAAIFLAPFILIAIPASAATEVLVNREFANMLHLLGYNNFRRVFWLYNLTIYIKYTSDFIFLCSVTLIFLTLLIITIKIYNIRDNLFGFRGRLILTYSLLTLWYVPIILVLITKERFLGEIYLVLYIMLRPFILVAILDLFAKLLKKVSQFDNFVRYFY